MEIYVEIVAGSHKLEPLVKCPWGMDQNEWIMNNLHHFYIHINLLYATVVEFCDCPTMNVGPSFEYKWWDGETLHSLSAPKYIEALMSWTQKQIDTHHTIPQHEFNSWVQQIFKRLFRVYAHIYHHHFSQMIALGQEPHLLTSLKHFVIFSNEFELIEAKEVNTFNNQ